MRIAGLAVERDDDRPVAFEGQGHDARRGRVDDPETDSLAGAYRHAWEGGAVDAHYVADAARHGRFHAIAEVRRDLQRLVEAPILDQPEQFAVDLRGVGLLDDERARQAAPHLFEAVVV